MVEWLVNIGLYFWGLFKLWLTTLFVTPWRNMDMLWLLIPIWVAWFFAEFFQEKHGTSMGNAITNAVVVIWGSVDCTRQTIHQMSINAIGSMGSIIARFSIIAIILSYGIAIVVLGLKGNKIIKYIGRVREVTYAFAIFTPIFYNAAPLTLSHIIAALLFFPLFYFAIELLDRYTPNPKAIVEDMEEDGGSKSDSSFSSSSGSDDFGGGPGGSKDSGLGDMGGGKDDGLGDLKL